MDYPFNLTGVLYFPKLKNDFEVPKNKIQLYSRQVFITDEVKDIVPEFLMLLQRGSTIRHHKLRWYESTKGRMESLISLLDRVLKNMDSDAS